MYTNGQASSDTGRSVTQRCSDTNGADDRHTTMATAHPMRTLLPRASCTTCAQFRTRWTIVTRPDERGDDEQRDADAAARRRRSRRTRCADVGHRAGDDPRAAGHVDVTAPADDHPPGGDHHRRGERDHRGDPHGAGDERGAGNEAGGDPPDQPAGRGHDQRARRASRRCSTTARRCAWSSGPTSATSSWSGVEAAHAPRPTTATNTADAATVVGVPAPPRQGHRAARRQHGDRPPLARRRRPPPAPPA